MAEIDTLRCYHALHARRPPHAQMKWIFLEAVVVNRWSCCCLEAGEIEATSAEAAFVYHTDVTP